MAFTHKQLPLIRSFHQALEHYNTVKPIRGRSPEVRPLGVRRRWEAAIDATEDKQTVKINLYGLTVIEFHAHDPNVAYIVVKESHYPCTTRASLIKEVLGLPCRVRDHDIQITTENGDFRLFDGMKLGRDIGTTSPVVLNPQSQETYQVSRKAMAEQVKPYEKFVNYMKSMILVTETETVNTEDDKAFLRSMVPSGRTAVSHGQQILNTFPTRDAREDYIRKCTEQNAHTTWYGTLMFDMVKRKTVAIDFLNRVKAACEAEDYEAMRRDFKIMAFVAGIVEYHSLRNPSPGGPHEVRVKDFKNSIVNKFFDLIKYTYADKIFIKEEMPIGKTKRDSNLRYVLFNKIVN